MEPQRAERRKRRSDNINLALKLWLTSLSRRLRLPGFILADHCGLVVATNLRGPRADDLAALAPLLVRADEKGVRPLDRFKVPLAIHALDHDRHPLLLCALGDRVRRETGARVAAHGIRRILREHRMEI